MKKVSIPQIFQQFVYEGYINISDIYSTKDGFFFAYKSISDILLEKGIIDFPGSGGERYLCSRFYDDCILLLRKWNIMHGF